MFSILKVLSLALAATPASASPVRRWLNTSSIEVAAAPSAPVSLPLSGTAAFEHAAADAAYPTSEDCDDMSTVANASPTFPAALSTIQTSFAAAGGSYSDTEEAPAPTQASHGGNTAEAYVSSSATPASPSTGTRAAPPYTVTSLGKHANATAPASSGGYGGAKPYGGSSLSGTTTLTLYTTVASPTGAEASSAPYPGDGPYTSSAAFATTDRGIQSYGGQTTTSMAAYSSPASSAGIETKTRKHEGSGSSPVPYQSDSASDYSSVGAYSSVEASSSHEVSTTRTRHRPTQPTHPTPSGTTTRNEQYTTTTAEAATSSLPAYPYPTDQGSSPDSPEPSTATADPVPTSYDPPSQPYSYSPQPSTSQSPVEPPTFPTSQAYSWSPPSPTDSDQPESQVLPTVVTGSPSTALETTTSTSSSSSTTTTSLAGGITIVPVDPDATTVYVTVTTTDPGMTTTVAAPTVTEYA